MALPPALAELTSSDLVSGWKPKEKMNPSASLMWLRVSCHLLWNVSIREMSGLIVMDAQYCLQTLG